MKKFNTAGICVPDRHYMADISGKLTEIAALIDDGKYFTINRGRQYGKTTTLFAIRELLAERYVVISTSFEKMSEESFTSTRKFVRQFVNTVGRAIKVAGVPADALKKWLQIRDNALDETEDALDLLDEGISELCGSSEFPVILMIDEVDQSSDNQVFLKFLGLLRNKYLDAMAKTDCTFHSVILAGVYDIKNLKLKLRPDAGKKYNSPWNIAVDFDIDMSFSAGEIAAMLKEYENDRHTGMDVDAMSRELHFYTGGYPYLVSWLCKWMDENGGGVFSGNNLKTAVNKLLIVKAPLFDDIFKKMHDYPELSEMLKNILFEGREYPFARDDETIDLGATFGIVTNQDGRVAISCVLFETRIYNFFLLQKMKQEDGNSLTQGTSRFLNGGRLDMRKALLQFQEIMYAEYREMDGKFYEKQGGLLFLCFLKPIINGTGSYFVEPQTRNNGRMDIVVFYGQEEFIIELKIWHGEKYRNAGLRQLAGYMDARNTENGYLISFNFNKNKKQTGKFVKIDAAVGEIQNGEITNGAPPHTIFEVVI